MIKSKISSHPKPPKHPNSLPKHPNSPLSRPGYEYLVAYQLGLVIQELTEKFTLKFIQSFRRRQQMDEASRSNPSNIAEGYTQESLKGYIYLAGIARGSNEELQKDYRNFLIFHGYEVWSMADKRIRVFREFRVKWISLNTLNSPTIPADPQEFANMLLTFCHIEGLLLRKLIDSLLKKHETEGGLTEKLYQKRKQFRGY